MASDGHVGVCRRSHVLPVPITYEDLSDETLRALLRARNLDERKVA